MPRQPFGEEDTEQPSVQSTKIGLKNVSTQKSFLDSLPKKPTQEEFSRQVRQGQETMSSYKSKTAELAIAFNKLVADKTLPVNKNIIQKELEVDVLKSMIRLAQEINGNASEREGEGSLSWITVLLRTCLTQRDRINNLEYALEQLQRKTEPAALSEVVSKEIAKALDKQKKSE